MIQGFRSLIQHTLSLFVLSSVLWACAPGKDANNGTESENKRSKLQTNCLQRINDMTCLVGKDGSCSTNPSRYTRQLRKIYEFYPDELKSMFCQLDRIQIDPKLNLLGQFEQVPGTDENSKPFRTVRLREVLFKETLTVSRMLTLEEQRFFGSEDQGRLSDTQWNMNSQAQAGPNIDAEIPTPDGVHGPLLMVLTHELGHVVDAFFKITMTSQCRPSIEQGVPDCPTQPGTFAGLSWVAYDKILGDPLFKYRDTVADIFNGYEGYIPLKEAPSYYSSLYQSRFVTSYSSRSPAEDFAESFLFVFLDKYYPQFSYKVFVNGDSYRMKNKLESNVFERKHEYIESVFVELGKEVKKLEDQLHREK